MFSAAALFRADMAPVLGFLPEAAMAGSVSTLATAEGLAPASSAVLISQVKQAFLFCMQLITGAGVVRLMPSIRVTAWLFRGAPESRT